MKSPHLVTSVIAVFLLYGCASTEQISAPSRLGVTGTTRHSIKITHNHPDHIYAHWKLKENKSGKGGLYLSAEPQEVIEWTNENELNFSIIVDNTNHWDPMGKTWTKPKYRPDCSGCGAIETTEGQIELRFLGETNASNPTNYHYQIQIPDPSKFFSVRIAYYYDYDMLDATIVWDATLVRGRAMTPGK